MNYVILGASAAGINAAKTLRELDKFSDITLISEDTSVYSRCMIHHYISGERDINKLSFISQNFFDLENINWIKGVKAEELNTKDKIVLLSNGKKISFDKLLIATGASSYIPDIPNLRSANNVIGLRNIEDAQFLQDKAKNVQDIAVLGAGLVGIDAVMGLIHHNVNIHLIEMNNRILPLQLDKTSALTYETKLAESGVKIYTSVKAESVLKDLSNNIVSIRLDSGINVPCDIAVIATGIVPNTQFIKDDSIKQDRGIIINERSETSVKDIYAAGDVTGKTPIWPIAVKQGIIAAYNMTGKDKTLDDTFALRNSMNFFNIPTVSIGQIEPDSENSVVKIVNSPSGYKKFIIKDNILSGIILQGDISYCGIYKYLIRNRIDITKINKEIDEIDYADFFSIEQDGQFTHAV